MSQIQFCCDRMESAIRDPDIPIIYTGKFNEYGVQILDGGTSSLLLEFCPFCGQKLPQSLRDSWFDELERRGIDPIEGNIPAECTDNRWYTKPPKLSKTPRPS